MLQWKAGFFATAVVVGVAMQAQAWPVEFQLTQPAQREGGPTTGAIVFGDSPLVGIEFRNEDIEIVQLGDYWIGLSCDEVSDDLRSHLKIEAGQGLIVRDAHEGKAAAKAGLKPHDVLLKADGKPVTEVKELIAAVQAAGEKELTLEIIREGERQTVKVTPEKRPEQWRGTTVRVLPDGTVDPIRGQQWITVRPGTVVTPWHRRHTAVTEHRIRSTNSVPEGVSVTITREGGKPAKITVKRGDDVWNIGEGEVDKLPADLQPHVRRLLEGPGRIQWHVQQFQNQIRETPFGPIQAQPPMYRPTPAKPVYRYVPQEPIYQPVVPRTIYRPVTPQSIVRPPQTRDQQQDKLLRELREELKRISDKLEELHEE